MEKSDKVKVSIDNHYDDLSFRFGTETLVFKRIPNNRGEEGIVFGLFNESNQQIGESFCRDNRFNSEDWYLDDIKIFPCFQRKGYGTELLEKTCEALWQRERADIVLERPGNSIASDGFDRKQWYQKHGFEPHPNQDSTWMWRKVPTT